MQNKHRILITGGTGYIGSHTAVELIEKDYEVLIIDNLSNSYEEVINSIEKITGKRPAFFNIDLTDKSAVDSFFKENTVDAVIHFAAYKSVGESVSHPSMYYRNNINSLLNVADACKENGITKFVYSSSCSVYGEPDTLPIDENAIIKPAESPYANTKKIGEDILRDISKSTTLNTIALRYFNPVGAHESALIGEYPVGTPLNLFPVITQSAIGKRGPITVFGNNYNTNDGSCVRDYIHVVDIARAHVIAIERLLNNTTSDNFEIFNLGTGKGLTVLEVINAFEKHSGVKLDYTIGNRRAGDVEKVFADTKKANEVLGWKATHDLESMITSSWEWEKKLKSIGTNFSKVSA
ncbi:MAG: UDP-glucose 4-epimerase GalE [Bacteroidota bacterium]|jgi:UDP-glucose 4-epimerase